MATLVEMGITNKGTDPGRGKRNLTPPPKKNSAPADTAAQGRFDGLYRLDGFTLCRSDGLTLVRCYRPGNAGSRGSNYYLVLASSPARPCIGNLYRSPGLDGAEFDDKVHRYRIEQVGPDQYRIRTLYRKGERAPRRAAR